MSDVVSRLKLVAMKLLKNCLPYCKVIEPNLRNMSYLQKDSFPVISLILNQFPPLQPAFSIELVRSSTGEKF